MPDGSIRFELPIQWLESGGGATLDVPVILFRGGQVCLGEQDLAFLLSPGAPLSASIFPHRMSVCAAKNFAPTPSLNSAAWAK
jgi:hypothetical protein